MRRLFVSAIIGFVAVGCAALPPATVHEKFLDNGLRVIVKEDHRSPVVTSQVWYKVGSIDEPEGLTGISHVLEHMMFKGTTRLKPNEFSRIIAANGGRENAFTGNDYTGYFQQLERSRLPISFELEADRMHNLQLAPEEFAKEVRVVMEERRYRTEDDPDASLGEKFSATAYQVHPYKNPVIGWMRDLERLRVDDVQRWYKRYYAPNNAVVIVVGDVQPQPVFALAERYYGPIPRRQVDAVSVPAEPAQSGERRVRVSVPAEVPEVVLGYHVPVLAPTESWEPYALAVTASVLDGGSSARFSRELVREQTVASSAGAGYSPIQRGAGLFELEGTPAVGHRVEELERALRAQVARLREELVSDQELQRIKAQVLARNVYARDSVHFQAMQLGQLATVGLDLTTPERYVERIKAVTAEQVREVARKYLIDSNLTVGILDPLPIKPGSKRAAPAGGGHVR